MAVVTVVSAKHAPGATTLAMLLAAVADPFSLPVLLEADPDGGDLGARIGTLFDPGMASLVEAARRDPALGLIEQHCRPLPSGVSVAIGDIQPARVEAYVHDAPGLLIAPLRRRRGLVVVDCGRWGSTSSAAWVARSDLTVIAMCPTVCSAEHVAVRLGAIEAAAALVRVVVIGDGPLQPVDVAEIIERPVCALPHDVDAARAVGEGRSSEPLRTTALWRAGEAVLENLLAALATAPHGSDRRLSA